MEQKPTIDSKIVSPAKTGFNKRNITLGAILALIPVSIGLSGCGEMDYTLLGAGAGALIGHDVGGDSGAIIGGVLGGMLGNEVYQESEQQSGTVYREVRVNPRTGSIYYDTNAVYDSQTGEQLIRGFVPVR